jgi:hypothetical protein
MPFLTFAIAKGDFQPVLLMTLSRGKNYLLADKREHTASGEDAREPQTPSSRSSVKVNGMVHCGL